MSNRYDKIQEIINNSEKYSTLFQNKKVNNILQFSSFDFGNLKDINLGNIDNLLHIVQAHEKLYMISNKYYGSPDYGWLICYTNKLSNELLIFPGLPLKIYFPLDKVLELF